MELPMTAVLGGIAGRVRELIDEHERRRGTPWFPSELLFPNGTRENAQERSVRLDLLRGEADEIPTAYRPIFVLHGLTEAGLPNFHRLLGVYLDGGEVWRTWINLWTAEENRHDALIHDLLHMTDLVDVREVERMQYEYLRAGFYPDWRNPYELLAYTVLQERATQLSHGNLAKLVKPHAPECAKLFAHIAAEEGRHAYFYRGVVRALLPLDADRMVEALWSVARNFQMPGGSIPLYGDFAYLGERLGVFGPAHFARIVREMLEDLVIAQRACATQAGRCAQEKLLAYPQIVERRARLSGSRERRELSFPFISGAVLPP